MFESIKEANKKFKKKEKREVFSGDDRYSKRARHFMIEYGSKEGLDVVFSGHSGFPWDEAGKERVLGMKEIVPGFLHVDGYVVSCDDVAFEGGMIVWHSRLKKEKVVAFVKGHERDLKGFDLKKIERMF